MSARNPLLDFNPYNGLSPFLEEDALFFFGRDRETRIIIDRLMSNRFTILYGRSGVGKSSILHAGVQHQLMRVAIRDMNQYGTPEFAPIVFPCLKLDHSWRSPDPLAHLSDQINTQMEIFTHLPLSHVTKENMNFAQKLKSWSRAIGGRYGHGRLFLILDQFEEFFVYHNQGNTWNIFLEAIADVVNDSSLAVHILLSIREGALGGLDCFKGKIPGLFDSIIRLSHLDSKSAREAIELPLIEYDRQQLLFEHLYKQPLSILYGVSGIGKTLLVDLGLVPRLRKGIAKPQDELKSKNAVLLFRDWKISPSKLLTMAVEAEPAWKKPVFPYGASDAVQNLKESLSKLREKLGPSGHLIIILCFFELLLDEALHQKAHQKFLCDLIDVISLRLDGVSFLILIDEEAKPKLETTLRPNNDTWPTRYLHLTTTGALLEHTVNNYRQQAKKEERIRFVTINPGLVEKVLNGVKVGEVEIGEGGRARPRRNDTENSREDRIEAAYLQLVMQRLWREMREQNTTVISEEFLISLGGVEGIVKKLLEEKMSTLLPEQRSFMAEAFYHLVTPNGIKIAQTDRDLADFAGQQLKDVAPVLEHLAEGESRILRLVSTRDSGNGRQKCYEIYHDKLNPAVQEWRKHRSEQLRKAAIVRSLASYAPIQQQLWMRTDRAALLALQAYFYSLELNGEAMDLVDRALREVVTTDWFSNTVFTQDNSILAVAAGDKCIAGGSDRNDVLFWHIFSLKNPTVLKGHKDWVTAVALHSGKSLLASGSRDHSVRIWNIGLQTREEIESSCKIFHGHKEIVRSVVFSPDGNTLATGSGDKTVHLWDLRNGGPPQILDGHEGDIASITFQGNGYWLASGSLDQSIRVWPYPYIANGSIILTPRIGHITAIAGGVADGDQRLACGSEKGEVLLWEHPWESEQPIQLKHQHRQKVTGLAFSPNRRWLASCSEDKYIHLYDLSDYHKEPTRIKAHQARIHSLAFAPVQNPSRLITAGGDHEIRVWDYLTQQSQYITLKQQEPSAYSAIRSLSFSNDTGGGWLYATGDNRSLFRWALADTRADPLIRTGNWSRHIRTIATGVNNARPVVAIGDHGKYVRIWISDIEGPEDMEMCVHGDKVSSLAISKDGRWLLSSSHDTTVRLWDLDVCCEKGYTGEPKIIFQKGVRVNSVAIAMINGQSIIAVADEQGCIHKLICNLDSISNRALDDIEWIQVRIPQIDEALAVAISPDGRWLVSGGKDRRLWVWDLLRDSEVKRVPHIHQSEITCLSFCPDEKQPLLAVGSADNTISLWQPDRWEHVFAVLSSHDSEVYSVAFSPDGSQLASGDRDGHIIIQEPHIKNLAEKACGKVLRNLTEEEWIDFIGEGFAKIEVCKEK